MKIQIVCLIACIVVVCFLSQQTFGFDIFASTQKKIQQSNEKLDLNRIALVQRVPEHPAIMKLKSKLMKAKEASCHYSNISKDQKAFECDVSVNQTIVGEHVAFNASFSVDVDLKTESAIVQIVFDGMVIYNKNLTIADLTVPICVTPAALDKLISLCLDFSQLKFDVNKECFRAFVSLDLKIIYIKEITIIPPQEFGWNMAQCDATVPFYAKKK